MDMLLYLNSLTLFLDFFNNLSQLLVTSKQLQKNNPQNKLLLKEAIAQVSTIFLSPSRGMKLQMGLALGMERKSRVSVGRVVLCGPRDI